MTAHQALCLAVENISLTRLERNAHGWRVLSINEPLSATACETIDCGALTFENASRSQTKARS